MERKCALFSCIGHGAWRHSGREPESIAPMQAGNKQKQRGARHILSALGYSICGLRTAMKETALRHELALATVHFIALAALKFSFTSKLLLTCALGGVLIVELLNTAIEAIVDMVSPEWNELAKKAKDLGSAAVFCALAVFFGGWAFVVLEVVQ